MTFTALVALAVVTLAAIFPSPASAQFQTQAPSPTGRNLGGVAFTSPTHGFVVGDNHHLLETFDGGQTWITRMATPLSTDPFYTIHFASPTHGYIAGNNQDAYRTTDGGLTWTHILDIPANDALWLDADSVLVIGGQDVYRSDDEGLTFVPVNFTPIEGGLSDIDRAGTSETIAGVSGNGTIWVSNDTGLSWTRMVEGVGILPANWAISFLDDVNGWVCGANGIVYRTQDAGQTWTLLNSGVGDEIVDMSFADDDNGIAVTQGGFALITHDRGQHWQVHRLRVTGLVWGRDEGLDSCFALDANTMWAGGTGGLLFRTDDGGQSWQNQGYPFYLPGTLNIEKLHFTDSLNGWMACHPADSTLQVTNDGGWTWTPVTGVIGSIASLDFQGQRGWAAYASQTVMRTTNAGQTWSPVAITGSATQDWYYTNDVEFVDENYGWAVGWWGGIARSTNGGASWTPQMQPQNETFYDVSVVSPTEAVAVGYDDSTFRCFLKRTTNGGTTWTRTELNQYEEAFTNLVVRPNGRQWIAGSFGKILYRPAPPVTMTLPTAVPALIAPGTQATITITATPGEEQIAAVNLRVRAAAGAPFATIPLVHTGGVNYQATLPPFQCGNTPQYYFETLTTQGTTVTLPAGAPTQFYTSGVGVFGQSDVFNVTFAGGLPTGWTASGLWHATASCSPPGTCGSGGVRMYFGQDSTCNFQTGARAAGILTSPTITLPTLQAGQSITLTFCSALDNEYNNNEVGDDDQAQLWWVSGAGNFPLEWFTDHASIQTRSFNLSARAGQTGRFEWRFDTMNTYMNSFRGWHVDDIRLSAPSTTCTPTPACDPIDFNGDSLFPDTQDIADFITVFGGGPCPTGACNDIDFNNDGLF
ncbi:MAG TPA: YCF48-related protein, partial [Phycisphaerales bacterium]|nr:YCF48-related protein [Phycisphaerales bacterium]